MDKLVRYPARDEWHTCHFCGTQVDAYGYEVNGDSHWLSDCRPDLVEHEIGNTCTWAFRRVALMRKDGTVAMGPLPENRTCYGYEDKDRNWTNEHIHFYPDGPM